jgi:Rrf2 family transcriptional regulator, iron-sulfur cluster assembly transcription factor
MTLLSRKSVLAIAAVTDIAAHHGKPLLSAKVLAARHNLAPRHLEPLLQALVHAGVLRGVRGPAGGYEIARAGCDITAEEIIRIADTVDDPDSLRKASPLLAQVVIPVIAQAEKAFSEVLTQVSVEDLVRIASTLV